MLMFKFEVEKKMPSGNVIKGCDYFGTLKKAETARSSYINRGFSVSRVEKCSDGEAELVSF